jgi:cytoskeletal protein RodZ
MSLLIGLLILAALVVGGVWAWGQWQARKIAADYPGAQSDAVPASSVLRTRAEPMLSPDPTQSPQSTTVLQIEPALSLPTPRSAAASFTDSLDAQTEMLAVLTADTPMTQAKVHEAVARFASVGRRSVRAAWHPESPNTLHVGLTLADRTGAVTEAEINHFTHRVDEIADALAASIDIESTEAAIARARLLDAQCAALDTQVQLHVTAAGKTAADFISAAEQHGFTVQASSNTGSLNNANHETLATLSLKQDGEECVATVMVDVPRAPADAFAKATTAARALATALNGKVIDDNGRELSDSAMALVLAKLTDVTRKLAQAGMEPGGERAMRLFS